MTGMHYRRVLLFGTLSLVGPASAPFIYQSDVRQSAPIVEAIPLFILQYAGFFACLQTFITAVEVHGTKRYFPVRTSSPHLLSIYVNLVPFVALLP